MKDFYVSTNGKRIGEWVSVPHWSQVMGHSSYPEYIHFPVYNYLIDFARVSIRDQIDLMRNIETMIEQLERTTL